MSVFVITVRNNGPEAATNVVVASNLSNDWSFHNPTANHVVSHGALSWSSTDNRNLTWGVPFIPNGGPLF
ncbi:conserved repeat domain-containing protein [Parapedobacter composti]|uniref:Conserved repeat domain-containing protein n=1 Tax=Parapedobacter composti TaxID=623281 RepID=A0A1I1F1S6_9SPHI|nr:DUF11 domain-containing protein [Parapedobacter composti]SFB93399.1 conserved repeat domain-containing protein [Parapedobacter composti]